jgi:hypothetical protein
VLLLVDFKKMVLFIYEFI